MSTHAQQEETLATLAQSFDAGDFDYLPPKQLKQLNQMIADAWAALKQEDGDVDSRIGEIQQMLRS